MGRFDIKIWISGFSQKAESLNLHRIFIVVWPQLAGVGRSRSLYMGHMGSVCYSPHGSLWFTPGSLHFVASVPHRHISLRPLTNDITICEMRITVV